MRFLEKLPLLAKTAIIGGFICIPHASLAQTRFEVTDVCLEAIQAGEIDTANEMATTILSWQQVYAPNLIVAAESCLRGANAEGWMFSSIQRRFLSGQEAAVLQRSIDVEQSAAAALAAEAAALQAIEEATAKAVNARICELQEVLAETDQTLQQAEAARQDRRVDTLAATIQECSAWFNSDPRSALTNDICNSIFVSGGLPTSEVSGPSTSEILLAELINENASTELEILIESGMLLETFMARAKAREISEDGDPYDCDE
jgi:hypothetical protein